MEPQGGGPYRRNARPPPAPRRRRTRMSLGVLLVAPRYFAVASIAVAAIAFANVNFEARHRKDLVAPDVERIENVTACASPLTIPALAVWLLWSWRRLPASRRTKRKQIVRATAMQAGAVVLGVLAIAVARPSSAPVLARATGPDGRVAYAYAWEWGCGYRVGVSEAKTYLVREIAAIGPFSCDTPAPRVEWRGRVVALVGTGGEALGAWDADR